MLEIPMLQTPRHPEKKFLTRSPSAIKQIVIHHTMSQKSLTAEQFALHEIRNDQPGARLAFLITAKAEVVQLNYLTTQTRSGNAVDIGLVGDFSFAPRPTMPQMIMLSNLCCGLILCLGLDLDAIVGHCEIDNNETLCPGGWWKHEAGGWKDSLRIMVSRKMASDPEGLKGDDPAFIGIVRSG